MEGCCTTQYSIWSAWVVKYYPLCWQAGYNKKPVINKLQLCIFFKHSFPLVKTSVGPCMTTLWCRFVSPPRTSSSSPSFTHYSFEIFSILSSCLCIGASPSCSCILICCWALVYWLVCTYFLVLLSFLPDYLLSPVFPESNNLLSTQLSFHPPCHLQNFLVILKMSILITCPESCLAFCFLILIPIFHLTFWFSYLPNDFSLLFLYLFCPVSL